MFVVVSVYNETGQSVGVSWWVLACLELSDVALCNVPLLRHKILRWFPSSGLVKASTVGAKNIASSSGWAINRHIRLLYKRGKLRANGEEDVADNVQKMKTAVIAKPSDMNDDGDIARILSTRLVDHTLG
ncbi:unnamed protein product [Aspergillus oryzae]|uniref:Unnamed protein product n=2 Tax=Aspergillus oryzae TaxID=5062 RepID=A0AAN4YRP5_ASPOZ|nr:unnamed protein product [Aspergillus oryzae]GMF95202.1 unnamed protein product [Aspergillus oryzae]GMG14415.1 unnamed protein product [Aspergillus oryzae]GMG35072.1 unnamed protein product [Aspergillus oryzae]GMG52267.1 unnamed protein product [Aspergillus oryzae var. brunneus]